MGEVESLEAHFSDLRHKLSTGTITPESFRREVAKLWFEDEGGRTWMIGAQTGHWYVYDKDAWQPSDPPRARPHTHTIVCPRCGEQMEEGATFCGHCGFRLSVPEPQAVPESIVAAVAAPIIPAPAKMAAATVLLRTVSRRKLIAGAGLGVLALLCIVLGLFAFRNGTLFAAAQTTQTPVRATRTPTLGSGDANVTPIVVALVTATPTPSAAPSSTVTPIPLSTATTTTTPSPTPSTTLTPSQTPTEGPTNTPRPPTDTPQPAPPTATATSAAVVTGRIAFAMLNPTGQNYSVYIGSADGSGKTLAAANSRQPQFNPGGSKLVVTGMGDFRAKLFVRTVGGGELGIDNTPIEARNGAWSPDGRTLIFASNEMDDRLWRLYIVDASNTSDQRTTLRYGKTDLIGRYPTWMAGGQIVYSGCDVWAGGGQCGIVRINPDGSAPTMLTTNRLDSAPAARANNVAFMSARDGNWEIYSVPLGGGPARNLSNSPSQDGLPAFSPDGQSIAFVSDRSGPWAVWAMRADGSGARQLFTLENGYANGGDLDWTTERLSWAP